MPVCGGVDALPVADAVEEVAASEAVIPLQAVKVVQGTYLERAGVGRDHVGDDGAGEVLVRHLKRVCEIATYVPGSIVGCNARERVARIRETGALAATIIPDRSSRATRPCSTR